MSGRTGQPFLTPYSTSKGALATLTRNTGFALMRNHIRVNQLDIGWMSTEGEDRVQTRIPRRAGGLARQGRRRPAVRPPARSPRRLRARSLFLASDDSGMMTGSVINFDQSVHGGYEGGAPVPSVALEG